MNLSVQPGTRNDDRYVEINMDPEFAGGMGINWQYKTLSVMMNFSFTKQMGSNPYSNISPGRMENMVLPEDMMNNHWQKPGDNAMYPRYSVMGDPYLGTSDRGFVDASFFRMNSISLSWSIPEKILRMAHLQGCSFSAGLQNLFTITKFKMDPEIRSLSFSKIPRTITCGLSFTL